MQTIAAQTQFIALEDLQRQAVRPKMLHVFSECLIHTRRYDGFCWYCGDYEDAMDYTLDDGGDEYIVPIK